ncbi:MAG: hypothetical protein ABJZ55_19035 [Fuerstiella sp.]
MKIQGKQKIPKSTNVGLTHRGKCFAPRQKSSPPTNPPTNELNLHSTEAFSKLGQKKDPGKPGSFEASETQKGSFGNYETGGWLFAIILAIS